MEYYEIRDIDGNKIEGGCFSSAIDAISWYKRDIWHGWLYVRRLRTFYPVNCD